MLRFPNCKINLGLYITARRTDGYHDLETVFFPVPLCDALEIIPAATPQLSISGLAVTGERESNLVWKAYQLLKEKFPEKVPALHTYLHKVIPMGAGLGGGSADGAFMLLLINDYCDLGLNSEALAAYALQLGSDCPFFIYNNPQYAAGRGEHMQPVKLDLSGYDLQLICPQVHVSTAAAFKMVQPAPAPFNLRQLGTLPVAEWKDHIKNDFEPSVFQQYPRLAEIKQQLYNQGAVYAAMSGSGSTLFGIFEKGREVVIDREQSFSIPL
jgi:4-diphosphocytidyl-2-C-methyl-D-erythritol kinase